jgi:hypothetical protein
MWMLVLGVMISMAAPQLAFALFGSSKPGYVLIAVLFGWLLIERDRVNNFPCPRCKKPFKIGFMIWNSATSRCLHGGLRVGADDDQS